MSSFFAVIRLTVIFALRRYILYNDLPQCLSKTKPRLFADDTNLTAAGESINDVEAGMNSDLENLRKLPINQV
jgi:hypothetical protein